MTLVNLSSPVHYPGLTGYGGGSLFFFTDVTLSSAGHYAAYVFVAREDMVVSHVGVRVGTSTGSPTLTVTVETVDSTTGLPNGAGFGSSSGTTGTVSSNTNVLQALGASATIPKGSVFAVKFALATGTSQVINQIGGGSWPWTSNLPYKVGNTGTPSKSGITNGSPTVAIGSSATTFYNVVGSLPLSSTSGGGGFNNTNGARRGLLFTIPMNCRAAGIRWMPTNSAGDYNAVLYDQAGNELSSSSTAFGGNVSALTTNFGSTVYFDNAVELSAGDTYRIAIEPTTSTNTAVPGFTLPSNDYRSATPAGTTAQYTAYASGSWDDSQTTVVPMMDLIIDQVDDGAGSGGGGGQRVFGG